MIHFRTLLCLVAIGLLAGVAGAQVVFEDGDFNNVIWPTGGGPYENAFTAGATNGTGDLHQWYANGGTQGQMVVEATGGNPGAYMHQIMWSDIRAMVAFDPAELGDTGTVNFDYIFQGGYWMRFHVFGLMDGQQILYWAGGPREGDELVYLSLPNASSWTPVSVDYDLTDTNYDVIVFLWRLAGDTFTDNRGFDNVSIVKASAAIPGDTDGDGDVDLDDLFAVRNNFGIATGATRAQGDVAPDPDGDGAVNLDDLFMVRNNFGAGLTVIPEPMTLSLLGIGGLALLRRKR